MENIKAIIKKINHDPEITEIENSLKSLQDIVGGRIEIIPFPKIRNVNIILNEEGKLDDLDPTLLVPEYEDILVGNIIIVGNKNGKSISLTEEQTEKCMKYLQTNHMNNMDIYEAYDMITHFSVLKQRNEMEAE